MTDALSVFTQNILPIFLVAALGYWLRRIFVLDTRALSGLVFNALSPALVFSSLVNSRLPIHELGRLAAFTVLTVLLMATLGFGVGRLFRLGRTETIVLMITLMFVNGGNYGLTLNKLRYGDEGLARAVVYYIVSTILVYSLGVFLCSMGRLNWRAAALRLLRVPAIYAVVLALTIYSFNIQLPVPILRAVELAGSGAIPVMLVVLGMNIAELDGLTDLRLALPATFLRLVVGPLVALVLAGWLGLQGLSRATSIIEASMPTAVVVTVLATEFEMQPTVVTGVVVMSTLFSPLTLTLLIALLGL